MKYNDVKELFLNFEFLILNDKLFNNSKLVIKIIKTSFLITFFIIDKKVYHYFCIFELLNN